MQIDYQCVKAFCVIEKITIMIYARIIHQHFYHHLVFHAIGVQFFGGILFAEVSVEGHHLHLEIPAQFHGFVVNGIFVADYQ